jgi:hypothetical protein
MWFVFAFFLVSLIIGIHYYFPALVLLSLFAGMLISAGLALLPAESLRQ